MNFGDMIDDPAPAPQRSRLFDFTFNLGHVFIIVSFLFSGGMFFADKQTHGAVEEQKVEQLYSANLPTRMQALETSNTDFRDEVNRRMDRQDQQLSQIIFDVENRPKGK